MAQLVEVTQRMELSDKELNDARANLSKAQRELKEQWVTVHEVCVALAAGRPYLRKVNRTYVRLIVPVPGYRATLG
ncbi:hypothetical protein BHM03_00010428 [Ensete ventricosum]|uniref:Uncharacterized protein n=1 Tax=Ensete ventricosum TaxID=4639 RepID=A0A445MD45_ENSVE|nr:hypothetical protein BHM03_00010428 [Ensete ventricosum]